MFTDIFITLHQLQQFKTLIMARKPRKSKELEKEILSSVPVEQRKIITQPITFTYLNGEMSMTQTRIQTMIMERLQDRIAKAVKKKADSGYSGSLFKDEDFKPLPGGKTSFLTFDVKYSELGVIPANYKDVDEAARAMQRIVYEKNIVDENGQQAKEYNVVFSKVVIPEKDEHGNTPRRDTIKLRMLPEVATDLFNLDVFGYQRYLKDAVFRFSGSYTGRIYLLINAYKQLSTWVIEYDKLRKILLTTYDETTKKYVADKYKDINDFKKRVLEPARKEIEEAADRIDCTFDYEFRYPAGKKRGRPEAIVFHIHLTDLGRNIKQAQLESQEAIELRNSLVSLHLSIADINRLMKETQPDKYILLSGKAHELKSLLDEVKAGRKSDIKDPRAYVLAALRNFIAEQTVEPADAEEIKEPVATTDKQGEEHAEVLEW